MAVAQRIAFVCPRFAEHGTVGGAETLLKALAERAAAAGRNVEFLTTCATDHFTWTNTVPPGPRTFGKLRVVFFPVDENRNLNVFNQLQRSIDRRIPLDRADEESWISHSVNSRGLIEYLKQNIDRFDRVVMGPYLYGLTYFANLVAPEKSALVPCLHDEGFACLSIMKDLFHRTPILLYNTEPEKTLARRLYDLPDRGSVVGLGMDPFEVSPDAFARRNNLTQPYVMYSGRREELKGTPLLTAYMNAFRLRTGRDVRLVFTGRGHIETPTGLEDSILDLGFVSELEKREAMAGSLCFIHPSINESLGIVLLESWLANSPALVHAKSEVLVDQCRRSGGGLWFKHYPEFEECLVRLMDDPALRSRMAQSGRQFVINQYSWLAVERRLFEALDGDGPT
ncbi:MAG TPA: glycosyltransferase family 4 protein [Kiritimatiellia bacterium]|nr:glycosyltransferase family 4 protein [Kiritimatiellia bacterium]